MCVLEGHAARSHARAIHRVHAVTCQDGVCSIIRSIGAILESLQLLLGN